MIRRIVSLVLLAWVLGFALFVVLLPRPAGTERTDAIVVPTGGPGRIDRGLSLIAGGRAKRMLITGVDRTVRPHELAATYKRPVALFDCCIDLGHEAVDTRSNGVETARWIEAHQYKTVRLVTTDWHMARARFELEHALAGRAIVIPDGVAGEAGLTVLLKEYNKYLLRHVAVLVGL